MYTSVLVVMALLCGLAYTPSVALRYFPAAGILWGVVPWHRGLRAAVGCCSFSCEGEGWDEGNVGLSISFCIVFFVVSGMLLADMRG